MVGYSEVISKHVCSQAGRISPGEPVWVRRLELRHGREIGPDSIVGRPVASFLREMGAIVDEQENDRIGTAPSGICSRTKSIRNSMGFEP